MKPIFLKTKRILDLFTAALYPWKITCRASSSRPLKVPPPSKFYVRWHNFSLRKVSLHLEMSERPELKAIFGFKCNILLQIKKWRNRVYKDHIIMCYECPSTSYSRSRAFLLSLPLPQSVLVCGYCKQYHNPTIRPSAQVSAQLYMFNGIGY